MFFYVVIFASLALGASSPNLDIESPYYRKLDKVVSVGLIEDAIFGQRPWSRVEVARMIKEAKTNRTHFTASPRLLAQLDAILADLEKEFSEELSAINGKETKASFHPLEEATSSYAYFYGAPRPIPDNNQGGVQANIDPLINFRGGRPFSQGSTFDLETSHSAQFLDTFSLKAEPRVSLFSPQWNGQSADVTFQKLYGKFDYSKFELEVGRDEVEWGQGEFGGLFFSNNARPLDQVRLTSVSPFELPWIFSYLGPFKTTALLADLGSDRECPNASLLAARFSMKPHARFEMGWGFSMTSGGKGCPQGTLLDHIDRIFTTNYEVGYQDYQAYSGFIDFRYQLPLFGSPEAYLEAMWKDFGIGRQNDLTANFTYRAGYTFGLYFPVFLSNADLDLRLEFTTAGPMLYRHSVWTSGFTVDQRILGDPLGPGANELSAKVRYDLSPTLTAGLGLASDLFDGNSYSGGTYSTTVATVSRLSEERNRIEGMLQWAFAEHWTFISTLGYERIVHFNFTEGPARDAAIASIELKYIP